VNAFPISRFVVHTPGLTAGSWLWFSTLHGRLLALDEQENSSLVRWLNGETSRPANPRHQAFAREYLIATAAEDARAVAARRKMVLDAASRENALYLTIAVTTACNFACSYCFQSHSKGKFTSDDVEKTLELVKNEIKPGGLLSITWFGGEPLTAMPQVRSIWDRLSSYCREKSIRITHSMISNGYLVTDSICSWMRDTELDHIQITLDGAPQYHDVRRGPAGRRPSFDRIVRNVERLCDYNIPVSIRVNVDTRNEDGISHLLERLESENLSERVSIYFKDVDTTLGESKRDRGVEMSRADFARRAVIWHLEAVRRGFRMTLDEDLTPSNTPLCVADHPRGWTISPNGIVNKCWDEATYSADQSLATLTEQGTVERRRSPDGSIAPSRWDSFKVGRHAECGKCQVQPICMGGCPSVSMEKVQDGYGDCTSKRWTIGEWVQLLYLERQLKAAAATRVQPPQTRPPR